MKIANWKKGEGPTVAKGYSRGDTWNAVTGKHAECSGVISVVGKGVGQSEHGEHLPGVLVRCGGCLMSWVLL